MPGYPRAWDRLFDDSPEGFALRRHLAAEEAKAARRARLVRAGRAGAKAGMVGGAAATGALAGSVIGSKLDRKKGGKKKMGSVVEKNLGLFARPMTMRRAKAAGRLARIKTDDAAVGAARGAGRATRYMNANAMPLVVGGSIGGGATMAGMQMNERRKMSKSYVNVSRGAGEGLQRLARRSNALQAMKESADPAVAARGRMLSRRMLDGMKRRAAVQAGQATPRVKKGLASALRPKTRGGKLVPAMRNPAVRARIDANIQGRAAGSYMATGTAFGAGRAPGNVTMGRNARANSRSVFRRPGA